MPRHANQAERVLKLARQAGVLRARDVTAHGFHPETLRRLRERGLLVRTGWGLYVAADASPTEHRTLAEVCKRVPGGVVCLLSALQFHGLTTQLPFEVWLAVDRAVDRRTRSSRDGLAVRIVRFSGPAFSFGIEGHRLEGVPVRVYNAPKTVADCFKFRHKLGLGCVW